MVNAKEKNQILFFLALVNSANFNGGFFALYLGFFYLLLRPEAK